MAEIRRLFTDWICEFYIEVKTDFMRDCRKMQHAVCGAAKRHIDGQGVQHRFFCHNIPWPYIFLIHFHNRHAGVLCKLNALRVDRRNCAVAPKPHAKRLRQAIHGIGRIHAGAGTARRTCLFFIFSDFLFCHCAGGIGAYGFKHGR